MTSIVQLARRAYELARGKRGAVPWERLGVREQTRIVAAYERTRAAYDAGRTQPRETRLGPDGR